MRMETRYIKQLAMSSRRIQLIQLCLFLTTQTDLSPLRIPPSITNESVDYSMYVTVSGRIVELKTTIPERSMCNGYT